MVKEKIKKAVFLILLIAEAVSFSFSAHAAYAEDAGVKENPFSIKASSPEDFIRIRKVNEEGEPLEGGLFLITETAQLESLLKERFCCYETDSSGYFFFKEAEESVMYDIYEMKAPEGYISLSGWISFVKETALWDDEVVKEGEPALFLYYDDDYHYRYEYSYASGKVGKFADGNEFVDVSGTDPVYLDETGTIVIVDKRERSLSILKTDEEGNPLENAEFLIQDSSRIAPSSAESSSDALRSFSQDTFITDGEGLIVIPGLDFENAFYVFETEAPEGYWSLGLHAVVYRGISFENDEFVSEGDDILTADIYYDENFVYCCFYNCTTKKAALYSRYGYENPGPEFPIRFDENGNLIWVNEKIKGEKSFPSVSEKKALAESSNNALK